MQVLFCSMLLAGDVQDSLNHAWSSSLDSNFFLSVGETTDHKLASAALLEFSLDNDIVFQW